MAPVGQELWPSVTGFSLGQGGDGQNGPARIAHPEERIRTESSEYDYPVLVRCGAVQYSRRLRQRLGRPALNIYLVELGAAQEGEDHEPAVRRPGGRYVGGFSAGQRA